MNYILAISIFLSTPFDHTDDICMYMSTWQGNITHMTIDTRDIKARLRFTQYGYSLATDNAIYVGNKDEVIEKFRRDYCPQDFI